MSRRTAARPGCLTQSGERVHAHTIRAVLRLAVIGVVAGFFSALFGVGGGLITVPLLLLFTRFAERPAMATSLGAIGITALAGTIRYAFHGDVEWGYAALVGLPASVRRRRRHGDPAADAPRAGSSLAFAALARRRRRGAARDVTTVLLALVLGFCAGVLSGLFGVGGGILFVPALLALGLSQLHAEATSLAAILPDRRRRDLAPAALRQRPLAGRRSSSAWRRSPASKSASSSRLRFRRRRCGACSPCSSSPSRPTSRGGGGTR